MSACVPMWEGDVVLDLLTVKMDLSSRSQYRGCVLVNGSRRHLDVLGQAAALDQDDRQELRSTLAALN